jgi:hypothetical protein
LHDGAREMQALHLSEKIGLALEATGVSIAEVAKDLGKDKSTVWRWTQGISSLSPKAAHSIIKYICEKMANSGKIISPDDFINSSILEFATIFGIKKAEVARAIGVSLPVPDIFVESAISSGIGTKAYCGNYVNIKVISDIEFIIAESSISLIDGQLMYRDEAVSNGTKLNRSGIAININGTLYIVGESSNSSTLDQKSIFNIMAKPHINRESGKLLFMHGIDLSIEAVNGLQDPVARRTVLYAIREGAINYPIGYGVDRNYVVRMFGKSVIETLIN